MPAKRSIFRRFYFDDGSSRKRWQVRLEGKSRIALNGRLQGALKESRTPFATAAEAAKDTEKLIAKKLREGYREVEPSRLEIVRPKGRRAATEAAVKAFEKRIGGALPDEYREFLLTTNGGRPNPDCVEVPGVANIANVGVGTLFHLAPSTPTHDELTHEFDRLASLLPAGYLPIAGWADLFTLSLQPKTFGCVHWWNHDVDIDDYAEDEDEESYRESQAYLLAGSFDEFLTRISYLFASEEDEAELDRPTFGRLRWLLRHQHTPTKILEAKQVVKALGDLSGIEDGDWPFVNIDDPGLLKTLLDAGLNPEIRDEGHHTLLWQCAGSAPCIDLLVERGVNLERRIGREQETGLMRAIFVGSFAGVARLIEAGANPTVPLPSYIRIGMDRDEPLRELVETARARWKREKS